MLSYADLWTIVNRWGIEMRVTRLRNLTLRVHGILGSRSDCLSAIVRSWTVGPSRHIHRLKRLHRFLKNLAVHVAPVFRPLAALVWPYRPSGKRTRLVPLAIDWTKVRAFNVLWAAVPRRRRALPLAFGVYHHQRLRHSQPVLAGHTVPAPVPHHRCGMSLRETELIRWLQQRNFAFVIRLRPGTLIHHRGRTFPLGDLDTLEGAPLLLSQVEYRGRDPVRLNLAISRKGAGLWYLGTSFSDAEQAVAWYKKRFWIVADPRVLSGEEMFRDFKSTLGLRQARLQDENRLARLLLGFQIAYLILFIIGFRLPRRWQQYLASRSRLSLVWLAVQSPSLITKPRHQKVWKHHIWPALAFESG